MNTLYYEPHNWLIHKLMWEHLNIIASRYAHGFLLDVGCGRKPYKGLFSPYVSNYFGLDYPPTGSTVPKADFYGDVHYLPVLSESVDTVLFSEVLEHVPLPLDAMREIQRILKPGGHLIITTPLFWHLHEKPRDYYRYTKYGLQFLLEKNGLTVIYMAELTGFIATFAQLISYVLWCIPGWGRPLRIFTYPVIWLLQRVAYWLNKLDNTRDFNCLTIAVGHKPSQSS